MPRWTRQYRGIDRYPTWTPPSEGPPGDDTYNRVARVLADPALTRSVIVAAARALDALYSLDSEAAREALTDAFVGKVPVDVMA